MDFYSPRQHFSDQEIIRPTPAVKGRPSPASAPIDFALGDGTNEVQRIFQRLSQTQQPASQRGQVK